MGKRATLPVQTRRGLPPVLTEPLCGVGAGTGSDSCGALLPQDWLLGCWFRALDDSLEGHLGYGAKGPEKVLWAL